MAKKVAWDIIDVLKVVAAQSVLIQFDVPEFQALTTAQQFAMVNHRILQPLGCSVIILGRGARQIPFMRSWWKQCWFCAFSTDFGQVSFEIHFVSLHLHSRFKFPFRFHFDVPF